MSESNSILQRGLWQNNPALVQLLGLCPLLAVTTTVVNATLLGIATMAVLLATNTVISLLRHALVPSVRIPLFVLIIASFVTAADLLINALFHDLHLLIGLFIPLIITNCAILAQAETVASKAGLRTAVTSALGVGLGFLGALVALGAIREVLGQGTLFSGFEMLFGEAGAALEIAMPFSGALAVVLAPGAFFGLALLIAGRNFIAQRANRSASALEPNQQDT